MYGVYVASLTGNIDLTRDAGISSARSLVNQRNQESRNTARRVIDGKGARRWKAVRTTGRSGRSAGGKTGSAALASMEATEAELKRGKRRYEGRQQARRHAVANLADEWDKPDFTMEQKQAAIADTLTVVIIKPAGKGQRFHPDQIVPVFRQEYDSAA